MCQIVCPPVHFPSPHKLVITRRLLDAARLCPSGVLFVVLINLTSRHSRVRALRQFSSLSVCRRIIGGHTRSVDSARNQLWECCVQPGAARAICQWARARREVRERAPNWLALLNVELAPEALGLQRAQPVVVACARACAAASPLARVLVATSARFQCLSACKRARKDR